MVSLMDDNKRNILLLVEGAKTEVNLFKRIIECFPEIKLTPDNIIVYNTSLWVLNRNLIKIFGENWYRSEDIDFREYIFSIYPELKKQKITDIFLIFDYERHDPLFNSETLVNMSEFFDNSIENGLLYINYPMVEAFKHLKSQPLPDDEYKERKCEINQLSKYKEIVGKETLYPDLRKYDRKLIQQLVIHNIKKLSYVIGKNYELTNSEIVELCKNIDFQTVVFAQNKNSKNSDGFVYVLCTCLLFISDFNYRLIFES